MVHRVVHVRHHLDGENGRKIFRAPVKFSSVMDVWQKCPGALAATQLHPGQCISPSQVRQYGGGDALRHQQSFHGVAGAVSMGLGVDGDAQCLVDVSLVVDIDMAVAIQMLDHGHAGIGADALDQGLAAAGHDHIHVFWHGDEPPHCRTVCCGHNLYRMFRNLGSLQPGADAAGDSLIGVQRLRTPAQNHGIAGFQTQTGGLAGHIRTRLVDDSHHAQGHTHLAHLNAGRAETQVGDGAHRVFQRGNLQQAFDHAVDACGGQRQSVEHGRVETLFATRGQIHGIGTANLVTSRSNGIRHGTQRSILLRRAGTRSHA